MTGLDRHPRHWSLAERLVLLTVLPALVVLALGGWWLRQAWQDLPAVEHLAQYKPALPLRIFSSEGELLAEYGEERREFLPLKDIPLRMRQALLAIEDARFYEHGAVDFYGLTRATLANVVTGHHAQGASTITMQVARDFFLSREKTVQRKLTEMLLAYKLEQHYGKDKLLELYMNQIYLGERSYGFSAASNIYFDKPLADVSIAEAACWPACRRRRRPTTRSATPSVPASASSTSLTAWKRTGSSHQPRPARRAKSL